MRILLFGATGMVGQGVLREALLDPAIEEVMSVVRRPTGQDHAKLQEIVLADFTRIETIGPRISGCDAALFCAGVTSAGMSEEEYTRQTYGLTVDVATALARSNATMTFLYVSGEGTDSTERGRFMWARVKGRTENALLRLPFKASYMIRPGIIQPLHGIRSKTGWYRVIYALMRPFHPALVRAFPNGVTTTEQLGRAMLHVAGSGHPTRVLETADINAIGKPWVR